MAFSRSVSFRPTTATTATNVLLDPSDLNIHPPADSDSIQKLAWAPTTSHLAAGGWDFKVRVWEVVRNADNSLASSNGVAEMSFEAPVLDVTWKHDGSQIFGATCAGAVKQWDIAASTCVDVAKHDLSVQSCHWYAEKQVLVTSSWDKTMKYWDCRSPTPAVRIAYVALKTSGFVMQFNLPLPAKAVSMDLKGRLLLLALSDRTYHIFDAENPGTPMRSIPETDSRVNGDIRCIRGFHNQQNFAVAGANGRVVVRYVDEKLDMEMEPSGKHKNSFSFRCHRQASKAYPVNFVDTHPLEGYQSIFATVGGDGVYGIWDMARRGRNNEYKPCLGQQSITSGLWNPAGDLFAYSMSYDWSKGSEHFTGTAKQNAIGIHAVDANDMKLK